MNYWPNSMHSQISLAVAHCIIEKRAVSWLRYSNGELVQSRTDNANGVRRGTLDKR